MPRLLRRRSGTSGRPSRWRRRPEALARAMSASFRLPAVARTGVVRWGIAVDDVKRRVVVANGFERGAGRTARGGGQLGQTSGSRQRPVLVAVAPGGLARPVVGRPPVRASGAGTSRTLGRLDGRRRVQSSAGFGCRTGRWMPSRRIRRLGLGRWMAWSRCPWDVAACGRSYQVQEMGTECGGYGGPGADAEPQRGRGVTRAMQSACEVDRLCRPGQSRRQDDERGGVAPTASRQASARTVGQQRESISDHRV